MENLQNHLNKVLSIILCIICLNYTSCYKKANTGNTILKNEIVSNSLIMSEKSDSITSVFMAKGNCEKVFLIALQYIKEQNPNYTYDDLPLDYQNMASILYKDSGICSARGAALGLQYTNSTNFINDLQQWHKYYGCENN